MTSKKFNYREEVVIDDGHEEDSRFFDTREIESREVNDAVMDYILKDKFRTPLDIENIPPDKQYYWCRTDTRGEVDSHQLAELRRKGFEPVPAHHHPEINYKYHFGEEKKHLEGLIYYRGVLLLERDIRYKKVEDQKRERDLYSEMQNIPRTPFMHEPTLGLRVFDYDLQKSKHF